MRQVFVLARNNLREAIRDRTVALVVFAAVVLVIMASLVGALSLDEKRRILIHLGFGAVHWSALALVFFQGAVAVSREIDRQTCLMVLARPVSRSQFLLGKFFAVAALIVGHVIAQAAILAALLGFAVNPAPFGLIALGIAIENLTLLAFIFLAAQFLRPLIACFATFALYALANSIPDLRFLAKLSREESFISFVEICDKVLPNLYRLNLRTERFLDRGLAPDAAVLGGFHFILWIALFLVVASMIFRRRDLV